MSLAAVTRKLRKQQLKATFTTTGTLGRYAPHLGHLDELRGCGCAKCSGLGRLGTNPLESSGTTTPTGTVVAAATSIVASSEVGSAVGSVIPGIGTAVGAVVGAVVGILTKKLFGNADYAAIYSLFQNQMTLFNAYMQVAGQYPGRAYGWCEMRNIWAAAMGYGMFPGNGPATPGSCTQSMISSNINACGNGTWLNDWLGTTVCGNETSNEDCSNANPAASCNPGPGTVASNNIANLVATAVSRGITDPVTMVSEVIAPGAAAVSSTGNNGWISITKSLNPSLYTQMLVDTADIFASNADPSLPVTYGTMPGATTTSTATPAASSTTTPAASTTNASGTPYSASGTMIEPGSGGVLTTPAGVFSFDASYTNALGTGIDGPNGVAAYGTVLEYVNGIVNYADASGAVFQFNTSADAWELVQAGTINVTATTTPAATTTTTASAPVTGGVAPVSTTTAATTAATTTAATTTAATTTAAATVPAGYYEVGTDYATGDAVYENPSGILYLWNGSAMSAFTGNLSTGTSAAVLQAQLQSDIASGQTQEEALANALDTIAAQGVEVTPEVQDAVAQQVATTAAAPTTVSAAGVTLSTTDLMVGGGVALGVVLLVALLAGRK